MGSGWWSDLVPLTRFFYSAAFFFSVFFIWQLISALIGLGGDDFGGDVHADADIGSDLDHTYDHFEHGAQDDAVETGVAFKMLSVRSIISFFTLFFWGAALYVDRGDVELKRALFYSTCWGLAGMMSVALIFYGMRKLTETGNVKLSSCVGQEGTVYLNIPADGFGEIRITVSDVVSYIKARSKEGQALGVNTRIKVIRKLGENTVEVEKV